MNKLKLRDLWIVLGAYGVLFAIFSGLEEISNGKIWKAGLSLVLGLVVYYLIEQNTKANRSI
jgi:hypothetical protein